MLARGGSVFLAGPRIYGSSDLPRGNITVYQSNDLSSTWQNMAMLHRGSSEYSSMVSLEAAGIGIVYVADDRSKILFQTQSIASKSKLQGPGEENIAGS